jgi:hypothetical protein
MEPGVFFAGPATAAREMNKSEENKHSNLLARLGARRRIKVRMLGISDTLPRRGFGAVTILCYKLDGLHGIHPLRLSRC